MKYKGLMKKCQLKEAVKDNYFRKSWYLLEMFDSTCSKAKAFLVFSADTLLKTDGHEWREIQLDQTISVTTVIQIIANFMFTQAFIPDGACNYFSLSVSEG